MSRNFLAAALLLLTLAPSRSRADDLAPLLEIGQPSLQPFSSWAYGYGALTNDRENVAAYVPASEVKRIRIGSRADVRLGVSSGQESSVTGTVKGLLSDADPRTQQSIVTIRIPRQNIPARTYAHVQIEVSARQALAVPTSAVVWEEGKAVVFKQGQKDSFDAVDVDVGQQTPAYTEIKSGLTESDKILIQGAVEWAFKESGGESD